MSLAGMPAVATSRRRAGAAGRGRAAPIAALAVFRRARNRLLLPRTAAGAPAGRSARLLRRRRLLPGGRHGAVRRAARHPGRRAARRRATSTPTPATAVGRPSTLLSRPRRPNHGLSANTGPSRSATWSGAAAACNTRPPPYRPPARKHIRVAVERETAEMDQIQLLAYARSAAAPLPDLCGQARARPALPDSSRSSTVTVDSCWSCMRRASRASADTPAFMGIGDSGWRSEGVKAQSGAPSVRSRAGTSYASGSRVCPSQGRSGRRGTPLTAAPRR
jgi:hypothetical protein